MTYMEYDRLKCLSSKYMMFYFVVKEIWNVIVEKVSKILNFWSQYAMKDFSTVLKKQGRIGKNNKNII